MAIVFQVNGFYASATTHVAEVRRVTRYRGFRVNAVISENCDQVQRALRIIQMEEHPEESLLNWMPLGATIFIVTPGKIIKLSRHKDCKSEITSLPFQGVYGDHSFTLSLLLRIRLSLANALYVNELIHGHMAGHVIVGRYGHLGSRIRKIVPPVLPSVIWSAFKRFQARQ